MYKIIYKKPRITKAHEIKHSKSIQLAGVKTSQTILLKFELNKKK